MKLVKARNDRGGARPTVKINFVVRDANRHEKDLFSRQWKDIVDRIYYDEEHNWSGDGAGPAAGEILHACLRVWNTFTVLWDGRVALCCLDFDGRELLGDLNSQTIGEVWQGPRLRAIREMHSHRDFSSLAISRACSKIR